MNELCVDLPDKKYLLLQSEVLDYMVEALEATPHRLPQENQLRVKAIEKFRRKHWAAIDLRVSNGEIKAVDSDNLLVRKAEFLCETEMHQIHINASGGQVEPPQDAKKIKFTLSKPYMETCFGLSRPPYWRLRTLKNRVSNAM